MKTNNSEKLFPVKKSNNDAELSKAWTVNLIVNGIRCPNCAVRVYNAILNMDGVLKVQVILGQSLITAVYRPQLIAPEDLVKEIIRAGRESGHEYTATIMSLFSRPDLE